jgi:hypothetical protein
MANFNQSCPPPPATSAPNSTTGATGRGGISAEKRGAGSAVSKPDMDWFLEVLSRSIRRVCGATIPNDHTFCQSCAITFNTGQVVQASAAGRVASHSAIARAQRTATQRENAAAVKRWDPATQPAWLTPEAYAQKVQPLLAHVRPAAIAAAIGVTWQYASFIRRGLSRPHPRHWLKLAELVGYFAN